jgi:hypothetical protein
MIDCLPSQVRRDTWCASVHVAANSRLRSSRTSGDRFGPAHEKV